VAVLKLVTRLHPKDFEVLVELRGFEPMAIAGAVRSRAIPPFAGQCARPARGPRLLDRIDAHALDRSPLAFDSSRALRNAGGTANSSLFRTANASLPTPPLYVN
jgi:hypothetical protein